MPLQQVELAKRPPVVVGGTGGSGTRAVRLVIEQLGVFTGKRLNESGDAMDFEPWLDHCINPVIGDIHRLDYRLKELADDLASSIAEEFQTALTRFVSDLPAGAPWGWKNPRSMYLLPFIHAQYPDMRFVHVVRDGRDMALSGNQNQVIKHFEALFGRPLKQDLALNSIELWQRANLDVKRWGERELGGRYALLPFERLCLRPNESIAQLCEFLGIQPTAAQLKAAHQQLQVPSSIGRWRKQDWARMSQLNTAALDSLSEFGLLDDKDAMPCVTELLHQAESRVSQLEAEIAVLKTELAAIRASSSWRLTAPLRMARQILLRWAHR